MARFTVLIALLIAAATAAQATTIHVPSEQPTIQAGIDAASDGDTVLVAAGTYAENISFSGKRIVVVSSGGPEVTTIRASDWDQPTVKLVWGEPKGTVLKGFTVSSGKGGIHCYGSSPTIIENVITGNSKGGRNRSSGITLWNTSSAVVSRNVIHGNNGSYGCAIQVGDGGALSSNDTICYNVIHDNTGESAIRCLGVVNGLVIYNNTIDATANSGGIVDQASGTILAINNIVFGASWVAIRSSAPDSGGLYAEYNCVFDNYADYMGITSGVGTVYDDAQFVNVVANNYHLQAGSPCIGAGNPDPTYNDSDGSRNDVGALPYVCSPADPDSDGDGVADNCDICPGHDDLIDADGDMVPDGCDVCPGFDDAVDTDGDTIPDGCDACLRDPNNDVDNDGVCGDIDNCPSVANANQSDEDSDSVGDACDVCFGFNDLADTDGDTIPDGCDACPGYNDLADADGDSVPDGCDNCPLHWNEDQQDTDGDRIGDVCEHDDGMIRVPSDQPTIQAGIDAAIDGDTVLVAPGTYVENIDFSGKNIVVTSSGGREVTTIQAADPDQAVVYFRSGEPKGSEISGFSITGGRKSGIHCVGSSPTILGNEIYGNSSSHQSEGAGVELYGTSSAVVRGNVFHDNHAWVYGTAVHLSNSVNDTVECNIMYSGIGTVQIRGENATAAILGNTISAATTQQGIQLRIGGHFDVRNNIVFGATGSAVYVNTQEGATILAEYNCIFNNLIDFVGVTPGAGTVFRDAMFADVLANDYHLQAESPCIDAGDPDPFFNDTDGSRNDMGALPSECSPAGPDSDGDGVTDNCDVCPGFDDAVDTDGDTIPDGCDACLRDPNNDVDNDGVCGNIDNCPSVANANQSDEDSDSVGDACDACPGYNDLADADGDSVPDGCDNCPLHWNEDQQDTDGDGLGDACEDDGDCLGQDPNDPDNCDSVIVEFTHVPNVAAGDSLIALDVIFDVDQAVANGGTGMAWDFDGFVMDSVVWTSEAETAFNAARFAWVNNSLDSTNAIKQFQCIGLTLDANFWLARGVVGTYWGHVTSWADGDAISISQNSWAETIFVSAASHAEYVPIWGGDAELIAHESADCDGQDPGDPGVCDKVRVAFAHAPDAEAGDSVVVLIVHFDVRDDAVRSIATGYGWDFEGFEMDSARWAPQGAAAFPEFPLVWSQNDLDSTNFYNRFQVTGFGLGSSDLVTSADICTFYGHVNTWSEGDTINIIPNSFVPMAFVTSANVEFVPVWGGDLEIWQVPTDVRTIDSGTLPIQFELSQNFPNPFNPTTTVRFNLPIASQTNLSIYNILGQQITTLVDEYLPAGEYRFKWNGRNAPSGVYLYKLRAGNYIKARKMVLLK